MPRSRRASQNRASEAGPRETHCRRGRQNLGEQRKLARVRKTVVAAMAREKRARGGALALRHEVNDAVRKNGEQQRE